MGSALYSHERPDAFDSVLLSFQDDDTKTKLCDLTVSAAFMCEVGSHRVASLASIYSVEREQRRTHLPRVAPQRCCRLFIVHFLLHQVLEVILSQDSCCCVVIWAVIKKINKSKDPVNVRLSKKN